MSPLTLEILANVLNLICVVLILFNKPSNWIFGIANSVLFIAVFVPAKLYGDASLQVMYASLSAYGLYQWLFGNGGLKGKIEGKNTELPITYASNKTFDNYGICLLGLFYLFMFFLAFLTNTDVPIYDGFLTAASVVATLMMAKRHIQHWYIWIATNVLYFPLYFHKGLIITAWCQIPLAIVSYIGLQYWMREFKNE